MPLLDPRFREDRQRYPKRAWLREQSLWAVVIYRFGRRNELRRPGAIRWMLDRVYWLLYRIAETLTGVSIPKTVEIGGGLRIHHFGCIFVNGRATIGRRCTLRQGVTIGNRHDDGPVPILEDDIDIGAFAQILGDVRIGCGARIGAMSVVLADVPAGATAVGNPARLIMPGGLSMVHADPSNFRPAEATPP
jgi:serine O-acetyltransferase